LKLEHDLGAGAAPANVQPVYFERASVLGEEINHARYGCAKLA
jgi:hypothetical protein